MKKQKWIRSILSIFLATVLLLGVFPVTAVPQGPQEDATALIVVEETELREESVKHFLNEDGSYTAAIYAEPVHFRDSAGEWQEIDNTLTLHNNKRSAANEATYSPAASGIDIRIPQNFANNQQLTISKDGYTVGMGLKAQTGNAATTDLATKAVINNELVADEVLQSKVLNKNEIANEQKMSLKHPSSTVVYPEIFTGADLEYTVSGGRVKESIIVRETAESYTYLFELSFDGLIPVPQEDGSFYLFKSENDANPLFILHAPYMTDAAGEESTALQMSLADDGTLTLTADSVWMNDENRVFPVVIDPTITIAASGFQDAYISTAVKSANYSTSTENYIGDALLGTRRTYIYFPSPAVPAGSTILGASLKVKQTASDYSPGGLYLYAFSMPQNASWSANNVTWNNQPLSGSNNGPHTNGTPLAASTQISNNNVEYTLDITNVVRGWYENNTNNGLMLATSNENTRGQIRIGSVRHGTAGNRPVATVSYAPQPSISATIWSAGAQAGVSSTIQITCHTGWMVTSNKGWLSASQTTGTGDTDFTISVTENPLLTERTGSVTVKTADGAEMARKLAPFLLRRRAQHQLQ